MAESGISREQRERYLLILELRGAKGLSVPEVAERMKMRSRDVSSLLEQATRWILSEYGDLASKALPERVKSPIEQELLIAFPRLKDVSVVPGQAITTAVEYDALLSRWGKKAAAYLDRRGLEAAARGQELHVCLSGGETILEIVDSLEVKDRSNIFFYAGALVGRSKLAESFHIDAIVNATTAWSRSGRVDQNCLYATVTPYDFSGVNHTLQELREHVKAEIKYLCEQPVIKAYLKSLWRVDIAIAGLGMLMPPHVHGIRENRLTASNLLEATTHIKKEWLRDEHVIGEIGYCYFDREGQGGTDDQWQLFLTAGGRHPRLTGIGFYRDMVKRKRDVIVCAGAFKEPAIRAALKAELFNVWFTNEAAARTILEMS